MRSTRPSTTSSERLLGTPSISCRSSQGDALWARSTCTTFPSKNPARTRRSSQALYGITLGTKTARTLLDKNPDRVADPLDYVLSLAEAGQAEMRALIFELRPESLKTEGLIAALEKQAAALKARHRIEVDAVLCYEPEASLEAKEAVYRIAQEAL